MRWKPLPLEVPLKTEVLSVVQWTLEQESKEVVILAHAGLSKLALL